MLGLGRYPVATGQFEAVLQSEPKNAAAHYGLALSLAKINRAAEANAHFREALWLRPDWSDAKSEYARFLATVSDETLRDTEQARALAESAVDTTKKMLPMMIDSHASATAAGGDKSAAAKLQAAAIKAASDMGDGFSKEKMSELKSRLDEYQSK